MALYHFSVKQVPEEKVRQWLIPQLIFRGRSFITIIMDRHMTIQKSLGVVFTEILTPEYAPERLSDRETLWNEVSR